MKIEEYQKASALVKDKFCRKKALGCLFSPFLWTSKEMKKIKKDPELPKNQPTVNI